MAHAVPSQTPLRTNNYVPNMQYDAGVENNNLNRWELGAPPALSAAGILSAQSIAAAGSTKTFVTAQAAMRTAMGRYGRNVTVIASGAATSTVDIRGKDYIGQPIRETLTLNGAATVQGKKAFAVVDQVDWGLTAATTINVGWGNVLGLPYASTAMLQEFKNGLVAANAGTFVAAVTTDPQTATTGDPRGTLLPVTVIPDGVNTFSLACSVLVDNLHGVRHFYS